MPNGWISIPGWRRFQHYDPEKRQPPWIKTYLDLLHDDEYLSLPGGTRSVLHGIWLVYASSRCRLRFDASSLSRRLSLRVTNAQLVSLCDAGFIAEVASAALAEGYHAASARARATETETEAEVEREDQDPEPVLGLRPIPQPHTNRRDVEPDERERAPIAAAADVPQEVLRGF